MTEAADALARLHEMEEGAQQRRGAAVPPQLPGAPRSSSKYTRELFWHYWLPVLVMLSLIGVESTDMMSGAHTGHLLGRLLLWLGHPMPEEQLNLLNMVLRKCGHVVGYGLLCASWLLLLRGSYWVRHGYKLLLTTGVQIRRIWWRPLWGLLAVLMTYAVASADEFHQMSMPSRGGAWHDIALDTAAGAAVTLLIRAKALRRCKS